MKKLLLLITLLILPSSNAAAQTEYDVPCDDGYKYICNDVWMICGCIKDPELATFEGTDIGGGGKPFEVGPLEFLQAMKQGDFYVLLDLQRVVSEEMLLTTAHLALLQKIEAEFNRNPRSFTTQAEALEYNCSEDLKQCSCYSLLDCANMFLHLRVKCEAFTCGGYGCSCDFPNSIPIW